MKISKLFFSAAFALLTLLTALPIRAELNSDGDFQYWNTEGIEGKISDRWKAGIEAEFRFGDDGGEFFYQHTDLNVTYKVCDWLDLGAAYRQVWELFSKSVDAPGQEDWFTEYRPHLNATLKHVWEGWELSSRNRFELRNYDIAKDDVFRYRNRFSIKSPWKWTVLHINPYIADEIFIQENEDFNRNRFYVGFGLDFGEYIAHLQGDIFYLWQASEKGDEWIDFHVLGTKLKLKF